MNDKQRAAHALAVKRFRDKHPEKVAKWNRRYYQENKDKVIAANAEWAKRNKDKIKLYARRSAAKRRMNAPGSGAEATRKHRAKMFTFLLAFVNDCKRVGCSRCNECHPACLDFHHIDRAGKRECISRMVRSNRSIAAIEAEMKKCVLLCSNCHRKEHIVRKDRYQLEMVR